MKTKELESVTCKICDGELERKDLARHLNVSHQANTKEYYDKYLKKPNEGICHCDDCDNNLYIADDIYH